MGSSFVVDSLISTPTSLFCFFQSLQSHVCGSWQSSFRPQSSNSGIVKIFVHQAQGRRIVPSSEPNLVQDPVRCTALGVRLLRELWPDHAFHLQLLLLKKYLLRRCARGFPLPSWSTQNHPNVPRAECRHL